MSALSTASPLDTLDVWLIDSGASRHLTGYKEALSDLVEKNTNLEIILHLSEGQVIRLQDVLYVPNLKSLVSILAMEDKGFKVAFIDGKVLI